MFKRALRRWNKRILQNYIKKREIQLYKESWTARSALESEVITQSEFDARIRRINEDYTKDVNNKIKELNLDN